MIVERFTTPVLVAPLRDGHEHGGMLHEIYHGIVGSCPGRDACNILLAQLGVEHDLVATPEGLSLPGMLNYNFGNWDITYAEAMASETPVFQSTLENEAGGAKARHWRRAFDGVGEGAEAYLRRLLEGWPQAIAEACDGSVERFAAELKRGPRETKDGALFYDREYYTAPLAKYVVALHSRLRMLGHMAMK